MHLIRRRLCTGEGETLLGLGAIQQMYEYSVPAAFESSSSIRCSIPATYFAGGNGIFDMSKVMYVRTTNDGVTAKYANTTFVFSGARHII